MKAHNLMSSSFSQSLMDIRSVYPIETVDNTRIDLPLSGFAPRLIAALIDNVIIILLLISILFALIFLKKLSPELAETLYNFFFPKGSMEMGPMVVFIIVLSGSYVFGFGYYLLQEWLLQGQTLGKRMMRLRVVKEDGQPIGFWEAFGRNLVRFFMDVYPFGLGLFSMLLNSREKRFGDYMVGTLVVHEMSSGRTKWDRTKAVQGPPNWMDLIFEKEETIQPNPQFEEELRYIVHHLTPTEIDWIQQFLVRRHQFRASTRREMLKDAVQFFRSRLNLQPFEEAIKSASSRTPSTENPPQPVKLTAEEQENRMVQFLLQLEAQASQRH